MTVKAKVKRVVKKKATTATSKKKASVVKPKKPVVQKESQQNKIEATSIVSLVEKPKETSEKVPDATFLAIQEKIDAVKESRILMSATEKELKKYYPWATTKIGNELFSESEQVSYVTEGVDELGNPIVVSVAEDPTTKNKSNEFYAVLSEPFVYFQKWFPISIGNYVIGMQSDQIAFNREYLTAKKWTKFIRGLLEVKEITITGMIEVSYPNITVFQISCFDPLLLQPIDMTLQELVRKENVEYMKHYDENLGENYAEGDM